MTSSPAVRAVAQAPLFDRDGWWDDGCREFDSLRSINALRLSILGDWMRDWFPDGGARIAFDFGCGGGLMAVPLAAQGVRVVGIDCAQRALVAASQQRQAGSCFVRAELGASPAADGVADLALLCDVLEHVDDVGDAIAAAASSLRSGGALFVNTINRGALASLLAVRLAEGLGLVPRGTHDPRMFVKPQEVDAHARACGLVRTHACGERPLLLRSLWSRKVIATRSRSMAVSYCLGFRKERS